VAVLVALMLPLIAILLVFAVDASNSWVHKRHLQGQVDAGVFAGALGPWFPTCSDLEIEAKARSYGGDENVAPPAPSASNKLSQFTPSNHGTVHLLLNSTNYFSHDPPGTDYSGDGLPCDNGVVDLKVTESDQPLLFGAIPGFNVVPAIDAHARVEIQPLGAGSGQLPIGVPDPNPVAGAAIFVSDDGPSANPPMLAPPVPLTKNPSNPVTLNGRSLVEWDTGPADITVGENNGVVIAFSGTLNWNLTGDVATICGQPLVECYQFDDSDNFTGLSFIHGFDNGGGSPDQPSQGDVQVKNVDCGNDPPSVDESMPYFQLGGDCTVNVEAKIGFGNGINIQVALDGPGCPNGNPSGCPMTTGGSCPPGYYCTQGAQPVIPSGAGPVELTINWSDRDPVANKNYSDSFLAHRIYAANDDVAFSGPIEFVKVVDPGSGDALNSVESGTSHSFEVRVGIQASLEVQSQVSDPLVRLRIIGGRSNNRHTLDCGHIPGDPAPFPDNNLRDQLVNGCYPMYTPNTGVACPNSTAALWQPQPPAWQCIAVQPGGEVNQVAAGLNERIFGVPQPENDACQGPGTPGYNNWSVAADTDGDGIPNIPAGDPRALGVFIVPFGSFRQNGTYTVPVTGRAAFYITGYTGQGGGFDPPSNCGADPTPGPATIVGHFMRYVFDDPGEGTGQSCFPPPPDTDLNPCIAVLTR
jgi:hypothetical protein